MRISKSKITELQENEIFVFGSNLAGRHGAGASKTALLKFGAIEGQGFGLQGNSFAIPTKNRHIKTMEIGRIRYYIDSFIKFATQHTNSIFLVTEIGCGLARYKPKDIAPLFSKALSLENVYLPAKFVEILTLKEG
jgi:hypothetical protein